LPPLDEAMEDCFVCVGVGEVDTVDKTSFLRELTVWPGCFSYVPASAGGRGTLKPLRWGLTVVVEEMDELRSILWSWGGLSEPSVASPSAVWDWSASCCWLLVVAVIV
jgi:hypothetical protein